MTPGVLKVLGNSKENKMLRWRKIGQLCHNTQNTQETHVTVVEHTLQWFDYQERFSTTFANLMVFLKRDPFCPVAFSNGKENCKE